MPVLDLSIDEVLTTTRSVRKRLDLTRPVEAEVIRECLTIALQAPTPGGQQNWHFIVVTDRDQREGLAALYSKNAHAPNGQEDILTQLIASARDEHEREHFTQQANTTRYLTQHLREVPVFVIPCIEGRREGLSVMEQAAQWGGIWPATWSFMLAARSRGLGTVLTTLHLEFEEAAAGILGIPYEQVIQAGLIPVAYTVGTSFKQAARKPLDTVLHWDRW